MTPYLLSLTVLFASCIDVQGQTSCGDESVCKFLDECAPLMAIEKNSNKSSEDIETLKKAQCGSEGERQKVCCPLDEECVTPEGKRGKCISLYSCPQIAGMLSQPVSEQSIDYVNSFKCSDGDQVRVCCNPSSSSTTSLSTDRPEQCSPSETPPDPKSKCCGQEVKTGDKIYGGTNAAIDQYRWLVIIEYIKNNKIRLLCGGALISGRYALTAGHCVKGEILRVGTPKNVRLGEYDIMNDANTPDCVETPGGGKYCNDGVTVIPIAQIIQHPDYKPPKKRNDIALLMLSELAPYTDFIHPICLPTFDIYDNPPPPVKPGQPNYLWVAGWGEFNTSHWQSNKKQHVDLPFLTLEDCQPTYGQVRNKSNIWKGQLCAGGEKGRDSCKGDSGGPLMYEVDRHFELIGIVSYGPTTCGMEYLPGFYTNVFEYKTWILSHMMP